jgi:ADP-ribose pyrophosphatase YjhB (NUDIX family)
MKQLHDIQLKILKKLLFAQKLRYTELKPDEALENNQFDFHLDQLIKAGYIQKTEQGYLLTQSGKEYANRMDTDTVKIPKQAKVSVSLAIRREFEGKRQYLIYTRLKQPFYGCQGFPSGKIRYGENVTDTITRELKEETNLDGAGVPVLLRHYRVFDKSSKELLEDKFMFYSLVENPTGELVPNNEGKFEWVDYDNLFSYVTNHFVSNEQFRKNIEFIEHFDGVMRFEEMDQFDDRF